MDIPIKKVLQACRDFKENRISVNDFHHIVASAEQLITEYEKKEIRQFFMLMENEIDYIRVMNNPADFEYSAHKEYDSTSELIPLVEKIEQKCKEWLGAEK